MPRNCKLDLPGLVDPILLDTECWECHGEKEKEGSGYPFDDDGTCMVCKGKGYALTCSGEAILQLLERHRK